MSAVEDIDLVKKKNQLEFIADLLVTMLEESIAFMQNVVKVFSDTDSKWSPSGPKNMFSVTQHIYHAYRGISYSLTCAFLESGVFRPVHFEKRQNPPLPISVNLAKFVETCRWAVDLVKSNKDRLLDIVPSSWVFPDPNTTLFTVVRIAIDHAAHHRGAISQYAHMMNRDDPFPYHGTDPHIIGAKL